MLRKTKRVIAFILVQIFFLSTIIPFSPDVSIAQESTDILIREKLVPALNSDLADKAQGKRLEEVKVASAKALIQLAISTVEGEASASVIEQAIQGAIDKICNTFIVK